MTHELAVPDMEAARRSFEEQEERDRNKMPQYTDEVYLVPSHTAWDKKLPVAAAICWPILGIFGLHHFYLRRKFFGILYACTFGLCTLGWWVDCFRIGRLVRRCNKDASEARAKGHWVHSEKYPGYLTARTFLDALLLWLPPFGLFGLYHFYLGRSRYGTFQACTIGFFVFGWFMDLFRLGYMVEKANTDIKLMKKGTRVGEDPYTTSDAYLVAIPFGIFGLHHFYMWNKNKAILYACTFGLFGFGWISDLIQMPLIVKEANKNRELRARLQNALRNDVTQDTAIVMTTVRNQVTSANGHHGVNTLQGVVTAQHFSEPPPVYRENAAEGETVLIEGEAAPSSSVATASFSEQGSSTAGDIPPKH